jgi:K+-sensing histidine kinase KdpD
MTSAETSPGEMSDIPWSDVVRFVRQLSHDLRNHLNAVELQSAYIAELATDPEMKDEVKRLRQMMSDLSSTLQKLSGDLATVKPMLMPYRASDLAEDLRQKVEAVFPEKGPRLVWGVRVDDATVQIDPQLLPQAFMEFFANAFRHDLPDKPGKVTIAIDPAEGLVLTLEEPKENFELTTENWGHEPLRRVSQGHYGLGLNRARSIIEAHGGSLLAQYDQTSKTLLTKISLPVFNGPA